MSFAKYTTQNPELFGIHKPNHFVGETIAQ